MSSYSSDVPLLFWIVAIGTFLQDFFGYVAPYKPSLESTIIVSIVFLAFLIDRSARAHAVFMQQEISRLIDSKK